MQGFDTTILRQTQLETHKHKVKINTVPNNQRRSVRTVLLVCRQRDSRSGRIHGHTSSNFETSPIMGLLVRDQTHSMAADSSWAKNSCHAIARVVDDIFNLPIFLLFIYLFMHSHTNCKHCGRFIDDRNMHNILRARFWFTDSPWNARTQSQN